MRPTASTTCRTSNCAANEAAPPTWRRIFRWPLFSALAVVHLALLPLVLGEDDQVIAMVGGVAYLLLAAFDWRSRRTPTTA
jgi:hypothetical protein